MSNGSSTTKSGRQLLVAVFTIAAALLVLSMVVIFRVGRISLEAEHKMAIQLGILGQLPELASTVKDAETGQRGYLLTGRESYLADHDNALPKLRAQLEEFRKLADAGEISKQDAQETSDLIQQKLAELAEVIKLRRDAGLDAAVKVVLTDQGKKTMDEIRVNIARMRKAAQESYDEAVLQVDHTNLLRTATFLVVTLVNLIFLGWAFRKIAQQEWLQFGQAQLSARMAGDQQLRELGENGLKFLAEYLNAQVGAIFIEEGGSYRQFATYAVPKPQGLPQKFSSGEGLIGQAVKDKRAFLVRDVPAGYLAIGSGLGQGRPERLIIAPMKVDDTVNAVVELAFFHSSRKADLAFLERVSEIVGVAVRSAQYRTRLQELLEETQRQAEEVQAQSEELRVSNEELEEQGRALRESQARLEQQQAELEQSNSQLEEQTQILETQKDDLSRAKVELETQAAIVEQASRYKSDFLANMSHELRTPLNSSLILAKILADNREGNLSPEQIKYAQTIQSAGNDLLALINDVLDLAKVEAGHMELKAESFTIENLFDGLRGTFEPLAANKGLTLKMTRAADAPESVEVDRRRLEQVLKNLLSNAVKFTERGEVSLEFTRAQGGNVSFAVRDTGIGIAPDQLRMIFEPFCQGDGGANRKYGGTGLGLSISRELVRLMGGVIQLTSELGRGSVFTVTMPGVYKVENPVPPSPPREPDRPAQTASPAANGRSSRGESPSAPIRKSHIPDDRERLTGAGRAILVVEDDQSFAGILVDVAHELSFQALVADTAEEALAMAQQFQPSAILLDIGLPDNSGMFVLERLKSDSRTRHIPVHVVSGNDYSETALSMGAVGYMLKPVKREQLVDAFHKLESRLVQKLRRVLLVEDDAVQLDSLGRLLGSQDVQTVGVSTAAECLEELKGSTFDCMVLDLTLPDASGFSLLETLSADEAYSYPPVIIYTGRELSLDEEQRLRKYSKSIIIKGGKSPERLLDEVTLFLHQVVSELPAEQQRMLEKARSRDATLEGKRILVAEDDVRNIFALTCLLEPRGVKVQIARNGREALQALNQAGQDATQRIDLVLMDIMMPEMNGLTAMREIRKNPDWKRLPIIALTAKAMRNDQEQCIEAGANDYLAKPLDVEKLLSLIRVWMPR
jgi:CheY-like chemotaxis protein/CHASE3 domain sensor protein